MNECNEKFFERNGISVEDVCSKVDCHIYSPMEVNPLAATSKFKTGEQSKMVSIADVVGYITQSKNIIPNVFLSMDQFFDEKQAGYSSRSIQMLEYDKDNILEQLKQSFVDEPMVLQETGEGTYTVANNGFHRYTVLRALYLSEAAKANGNEEELAKLSEKYTIPASVIGVDLDKTYCKYILDRTEFEGGEWNVLNIFQEVYYNRTLTGNVVIEYENGRHDLLTPEQLIGLTRERVLQDDNFKGQYANLQVLSNKYPSFGKFIDEHFSDLIHLSKEQSSDKGER